MSARPWVISAVCLLLSAIPGRQADAATAVSEQRGILSETALRDLLAGEIKERLSRPARFTLLPNNIARVHLSKNGAPIFVMSKGDAYDPTQLSAAIDSLGQDRGGFRLMIEGNVAGFSDDGEIVVTDGRGSGSAVVGPAGVRPTGLPKGLALTRAFRIGNKWLFQTSAGFIEEGASAALEDTDDASRRKAIVATDEGLLSIRPNERVREGEERPLVFEFMSAQGVERQNFRNIPFSGVQGVVRLRDGKWLAVGEKLAVLRDDWPASPPESDLKAALRAVDKRDDAAFLEAMERLTLYREDTLRGLVEALVALPDPTRDLREVEDSVRRTLGVMDRLEAREADRPGSKSNGELDDAVANYRTNAIRFLTAIQQARGSALADAPATVAGLIRQGYQYFDGRWIGRPRLLAQNRIGRAYLLMSLAEVRNPAPRQALFVVNEDGRLHLLEEFGQASGGMGANGVVIADGEESDLLFIPRYGLARIAQGTLQWVDRSAQMKTMTALLGRDRNGYLYFAQADILPWEWNIGNQTLFWVYKSAGTPSEGVNMLLMPTISSPIADSLGRIWFIHSEEEARIYREEWPGLTAVEKALSAQNPLRQAHPRQLTRRGKGPVAGSDTGSGPTLYCQADGQLYRCLSQPGLRSAVLLAGAAGALFVVPSRTSEPTLVIDDDVLVEGANLHALAETEFELLLRTAPTQSSLQSDSAGWAHSFRPAASMCRNVDMLWICQSNRIEVYRNGKSLSMDKRLALLSGRMERSGILGPVAGAAKSMLLVMRPESVMEIFWATPNADGIALERSLAPPKEWPGNATLTSPEHLSALPLLDRISSKVYYYNGFERVWEASGPGAYAPLPDAALPVLALRQGGMLVYRQGRTYRGYRRFSAGTACDITPTYLRHLRIIREEEDGRMLGLGPEGMVWLRVRDDGTTVIEKEVPVRSGLNLRGFLSENDRESCFMALDAAQRPVIAIWRRE